MNAEFDSLLGLMYEGRLTPTDAAQLEALVLSNPRALRRYLQETQFDSSLRWIGSCAHESSPPTAPTLRQHVEAWVNRPWTFSTITACSCMFAVITLLAVWRVQTPPAPTSVAAPRTAQSAAEAFVAIQLAPGRQAASPSEERVYLAQERTLTIAEGEEMRIVFGSGAEVVISGPGQFMPQTTHSGRLIQGRLRARIEHGLAQRFEIVTPSARIVDLGTDFEVFAPTPTQTAVRVITGRVEVTPQTPPGRTGTPRVLDADEAVLVNGVGLATQTLTAEARAKWFPHSSRATWTPLTTSDLPVQDRLVVHLDAANVNGADNAGLNIGEVVRAWRNLAPLESSLGHFFGSAMLHESSTEGRPTLRFNGKSDYFRNPQTLGNSADESLTLFVVAQREADRFGQLVATHHNHQGRGWGIMYAKDQQVMFYHTMFRAGLVGRPFNGLDRGLQLVEAMRTAHGDDRRLELRVNGGEAATAPDTRLNPSDSGTTIGGILHFLDGQIAEVVIYRRTLAPHEADQVRRHLMEKHQLPSPPLKASGAEKKPTSPENSAHSASSPSHS